MKEKLIIAGFILLTVVSLGCVCFAGVMQARLQYELYGAIFTDKVFIPHWSAWFYLGAVGLVPAFIWFEITK